MSFPDREHHERGPPKATFSIELTRRGDSILCCRSVDLQPEAHFARLIDCFDAAGHAVAGDDGRSREDFAVAAELALHQYRALSFESGRLGGCPDRRRS